MSQSETRCATNADSKEQPSILTLGECLVDDFCLQREVVEIDSETSIDMALHKLLEKGVKSMPVYDRDTNSYIGWIDARRYLAFLMQHQEDFQDMLEDQSIDHTIRGMIDRLHDITNTSLSAASSGWLYQFESVDLGSKMIEVLNLLASGYHRVPITDPNSSKIVKIISQSDILDYLTSHQNALGPIGNSNLCSVPFTRKISTISTTCLPLQAFRVLNDSTRSAMPIVEKHGKIVSVLSDTDVYHLSKVPYEEFKSMDILAAVAAAHGGEPPQPLTCTVQMTLEEVLTILNSNTAHRLYVVNNTTQMKPIGVISLKDVIKYCVNIASGRYSRRRKSCLIL